MKMIQNKVIYYQNIMDIMSARKRNVVLGIEEGVGMESEFLNKYGYGDEDNFDEDSMTEDLITFMLQVGFKEKRINEILKECNNEKSVDLFMEYYQKRKELAEQYIEKIKQTEKEDQYGRNKFRKCNKRIKKT